MSKKTTSSGAKQAYSQLSLFGDDEDDQPLQQPESAPADVASTATTEKRAVKKRALKKRPAKKRSAKKVVDKPDATVELQAQPSVVVEPSIVNSPPAAVAESTRPAGLDGSTKSMVRDEASMIQTIESANADLTVLRVDRPEVESWAQPVEGDALATRLVRASAGTGKTYKLTARLLTILLQGSPPETILATTFTRKAAGEILTRLLTTLANAADENNDTALDELRQQVGIETISRRVCEQLLDKILRNIHRLRISTLDSLFAQLARSFPFELGLPAAWRLTDEIEEVWLRERAVESVVSSLDTSEMMTLLSMLGKGEARRSVAFELISVVSAAYSSQRQCPKDVWNQLLAPKRPESEDLTRAAGYFRQAEPKQKSLRTRLEKLAASIEQRNFASLGQDSLIANIAKARRSKEQIRYGQMKLPEELDESLDLVYEAVRSDVLALLQAQNEATGNVLAAYDTHITQLKETLRTLGFDDIAVRLADQFRSLDPADLARRLDGAIDHLLLDEFQDTSPIQWQVLRPIATRAATYDPNDQRGPEWQVQRSFFCVGDTKQAIYGWRGGEAAIFDAVAEQIEGVKEEELNKSFRSSPVILDVVDRTFMNLQRHSIADDAGSLDVAMKSTHVGDALVGFSRNFPKHEAHKAQLPGFASYETARKVETRNTAEKHAACFELVAERIHELNQKAPHLSIGVLTRGNSAVAQLIFLLDALGVEVSQEGGNPLVDSAAVDLVLSALMAAEHPGDRRWSFHIQNSPIGEALGDEAGEIVRRMTEDRGLSEAIEHLAGILASSCDARDVTRLRQLTQLAMNYQQNAAPRLRDFVRLVREKRIERPQSAPVRVMTIHQAKGLEFDAVFLPELLTDLTKQSGGCVSDTPQISQPPQGMTRTIGHKAWHFLPENWQRVFGKKVASELTESLCLLYVAMTRARQALYMFTPPSSNSDFSTKKAAALLFHALDCSGDPKAEYEVLFQTGDPNWHQTTASPETAKHETHTDEPDTAPQAKRQIQFRPLPDVPRRNHRNQGVQRTDQD